LAESQLRCVRVGRLGKLHQRSSAAAESCSRTLGDGDARPCPRRDHGETAGAHGLTRADAIINAGCEVAGPTAAAAVGLLIGGDAGAVAGAAAASPATAALRQVLAEAANRLLGRREERRVGAVLLAAEAEIQSQLADGRQVRDDGLFGSGDARSDAEEIAEAAILAAQRDPQEAKAPLMGKMLGRLQFDDRVSVPYAHLLIRQAEALTYRQLCCLGLFGTPGACDTYSLPDQVLSGQTDALDPRIGLLQEILDLYRRTMIQQRAEDHPGTDILTYAPSIRPARLEVTGLGAWLIELMDLRREIPPAELEEISALLRG
jgi:hypothetical protein